MPERIPGYIPDKVEPIDPKIAEAIKGQEGQIVQKANEIIRAAGVIQLPTGQDGPTKWLQGGDTTIQAFSSAGDITFRTVTQHLGQPRATRILGDKPIDIFYVMVETPQDPKPQFLYLVHTFSSTFYRELLARPARADGDFDSDNYERETWVKAGQPQVSAWFNSYLSSLPRPDLANQHYEKLTGRNAIPGHGKIVKTF